MSASSLFANIVKYKVPHKPSDMSMADWNALCERHGRPMCENLATGLCLDCCGDVDINGEVSLEVDHVQSRANGGETSARNCRFICMNGSEYANRNRGAASDDRWLEDFWFDRRSSFDGLRKAQLYAGPQAVQMHSDLFVNRREELTKYCSLLALTTGAGKTMLIVGTLLAINDEVLRNIGKSPRVGRVLYFVSERALADQLEQELRTEVVQFGLHLAPPSIQKCTEKGDLERGPGHHDFTIACPHALWDRKNQTRTDADIIDILSKYDTIVWDECDFANGQLNRLVKLGRHALKFGLTATPINGDGDFLQQFVVASTASYRTVFEADRCLKVIPTWEQGIKDGFIRPIGHDGFVAAVGGNLFSIEKGTHGDKSSISGAMASIRSAIDDSAKLEQQMQFECPDLWYTPHLLVRCGNVDEAKHLAGQTEQYLSSRKPYGFGWRTSIIYASTTEQPFKSRPTWDGGRLVERLLEEDEKALIHSKPKKVHPWLRAKAHQGRCLDDNKFSRILFVVDMGVRGLNNWPCLWIIDIARSNSVSVQCQLRGREDRLPSHLSKWLETEDGLKKYHTFITGRYYFPVSGGDACAMEQAFSYLHEMDVRFESSGLQTWSQLLDGADLRENPPVQGTQQPFTLADRLQMDTELGRRIEDGDDLSDISDEEINALVDTLPPEVTDARREFAKKHIRKVLEDEEYRKKLSDIPKMEPLRAIHIEKPKSYREYSTEELIGFVSTSPLYDEDRAEFIAAIIRGDSSVMKLIGLRKHEDVQRHYFPAVRIMTLNPSDETKDATPSIVSRLCGSLKKEMADQVFADYRQANAAVYPAVKGALKIVFGVDDISNGGALDTPAYHHKILSPNVQRKIKEIAVKIMLQNGDLGSASALYRK